MPKSYEEQLEEMITPVRGRRSVLVTDEEYEAHMRKTAVAPTNSPKAAKTKPASAAKKSRKPSPLTSKSHAYPTPKTGGKTPMFMN